MRKTKQFMAVGITVLILVMAAGCASGGSTQQTSASADSNPWVGVWEGKDAKGDVYSFHFTATGWESYIERSGVTVPFYKGTYTYTASRVTLQVTEEVDTSTMKWMAHKDNFPPITGRLTGNVLNLPTFTEADLLKE